MTTDPTEGDVMPQASHPVRNRTIRAGAVLLVPVVVALGLSLAGHADAQRATAQLELTMSSPVSGLPYRLQVHALTQVAAESAGSEAAQGDAGTVDLELQLLRSADVSQVHEYAFSTTSAVFTMSSKLSEATLQTKGAMGAFGKISVGFSPSRKAVETTLKCPDGSVSGSRLVRQGSFTGTVTFHPDADGTDYFGTLSNRGPKRTVTADLRGVLTRTTITTPCPGPSPSPRPSPSPSSSVSPSPSGSPTASPSAAVAMVMPATARAATTCPQTLSVTTTETPSFRVTLSQTAARDTLGIVYTEDPQRTAPATVSHALQITVKPSKHPFSATFGDTKATARLKAAVGKPYSEGVATFSGAAATSTDRGSCVTKRSDGEFHAKLLVLHFDSLAAGKKVPRPAAGVPASLVDVSAAS